ncbi:MAG: SDR family oxidoreductase [Alphaproteobacteria bacterium]|nr:SDR family oxidoreductase [Alphaproteobacteria bacterium]
MIDLSGKTIFVTGASRGAGAGIARTLAGAGADVIGSYSTNRKAADAVAAGMGARARGFVQADFGDPDAAETAWAEAMDIAGGRIDGLVLNHGIFEGASIHDDAPAWQANWARTLQVNLQSAADLARLAARDWVDGAGGSLVAISSRAAHRGDDLDHPAYAASKAGLIAMIKTLARAYSGRGLLAYAISPGWIDTEMAPQEPEARKRALAEVPYGDMAQPEELGKLCAFLLSGACASATGGTFDVNGASYVR